MPRAEPPESASAVRRLGGAADFARHVGALARQPRFWWLDSALPGPPLGRWSFAGARPYAVVRAFGDRVRVEVLRPVRPDLSPAAQSLRGDPLALLEALVATPPADAPSGGDALPFVGGAVGYLGYELARFTEGFAPTGRNDAGLPDAAWLLVDRGIALDHLEGAAYAFGLGFAAAHGAAHRAAARAVDALCAELAAAPPGRDLHGALGPAPPAALGPDSSAHGDFDVASYGKAVERILERIGAGDLYQANLTQRLERRFRGDPLRAYEILRARNPAPFAAYLDLPGATVLSSSPERFLALDARGRVESRPIKGTRRREADPARDRAAARALADSGKDRAENLMIVDLVRNDLGRVCEIGTVHVPELRGIESYATVHQMVSTVRGVLRPGAGRLDLLRATFPPGSMTGAPKRAAMVLLDRLEPVRRGPYAGALGFLDARGGLGLSVVIRAALLAGGRAHVHAGGGIVADSDPRAEWEESLDKARAVLAALDEAERR